MLILFVPIELLVWLAHFCNLEANDRMHGTDITPNQAFVYIGIYVCTYQSQGSIIGNDLQYLQMI